MATALEATSDFRVRFDLAKFFKGDTFGHHVCQLMVALAAHDGHVTLEEYRILLEVTGGISNIAPHPQGFNALICHCLLAPEPVDTVLAKLATSAPNMPQDARAEVFELVGPLLALQGEATRETLVGDVRAALGLDKTITVLKNGLSKWWRTASAREDWRSPLRALAETYRAGTLLQALDDYDDKDPAALARIHHEFGILRASVLDAVRDFQCSAGRCEVAMSDRATELANLLLDETAKRLTVVNRRLELQHEMFVDDVEDFFERALDAFLSAAHDQRASGLKAWESFRNTSGGRAIFKPYKALRERYGRINEMWDYELRVFTEELGRLNNVLKNHHSADFGRMIPPRSLVGKGLDVLDTASHAVLGVAGVGAAGVSAAAALFGGKAVFIALSAIVSPPVGIAALGALVAAGLFTTFSRAEDRHHKEIKRKGQELEVSLREFLGNPVAEHEAQLQAIRKRFWDSAQASLLPVAVDIEASRFLAENQPKAIAAMAEATAQVLDAIRIPEPKINPA